MTQLTEQALRSKIETVAADLQALQSDGNNIRKVEALTEYKKYLEDELELLIESNKGNL